MTPVASSLSASRLRRCPSVVWFSYSWFYTWLFSLTDVECAQVFVLCGVHRWLAFWGFSLRTSPNLEDDVKDNETWGPHQSSGSQMTPWPLITYDCRAEVYSQLNLLLFFSLKNACQYIYIYIFNLGVSKIATIYLRVLLDVWLLEFSSPQPLSLHLTRERPYQEGIKGTT